MDECVFCAIRDHGLANALYEDDKCFAILDKFPAERGHLLVISREHHTDLITAPESDAEHAFAIAKRFAARCKDMLHATGVSVLTNSGRDAGQVVPHFHIHVIPKYPAGQREMRYNGRLEITPDDATVLSKLLGMRK